MHDTYAITIGHHHEETLVGCVSDPIVSEVDTLERTRRLELAIRELVSVALWGEHPADLQKAAEKVRGIATE